MTERRGLENALSEWLGSVVIGAIPMAIHLLTLVVADTDGEADWIPDLAFWVIALSGTSGTQANFRLSRRKNEDLGRAPGALVAVSFMLVALAAFLYGIYVSGSSCDYALWAAICLLFGSLISSGMCDYVVARRCAE